MKSMLSEKSINGIDLTFVLLVKSSPNLSWKTWKQILRNGKLVVTPLVWKISERENGVTFYICF